MTNRLDLCQPAAIHVDAAEPIMRRDHSPSSDPQPFDRRADEAHDVTQEFWGTSRSWTPRSDATGQVPAVERPTTSLAAVRASLGGGRVQRPAQRARATGSIDRTRSHGIPRPSDIEHEPEPLRRSEVARREASLGELAAGRADARVRAARNERAGVDADLEFHRSWNDSHQGEVDITNRVPVVANRRPQADARRVVPSAAPATRGPQRQRPGRPAADDEFETEVALHPIGELGQRLGLGAVDPLLRRIGAIVIIGVMLVPFARGLRPDADAIATADAALGAVALAPSGDPAETVLVDTALTNTAGLIIDPQSSAAPAAIASPVSNQAAPSATVVPDPAITADPTSGATAATSAGDSSSTDSIGGAAVAQDVEPDVGTIETGAEVDQPAVRAEPECAQRYEAGAGDSWFRIADEAGIGPNALTNYNGASFDTVILPGDTICLPAEAEMPSQPTTTSAAPATTTAPASTAPATTKASSTTTAPATTAPASTAPAPKSTTSEVQAMIREIWPDELEERALQIAFRESRYVATAYNGTCCYGVFQIHWGAHKSWLDDYGITSTNDLFDARKNITAAYAIYQRAGGWGPWGG